jgi:hypothetical protein
LTSGSLSGGTVTPGHDPIVSGGLPVVRVRKSLLASVAQADEVVFGERHQGAGGR